MSFDAAMQAVTAQILADARRGVALGLDAAGTEIVTHARSYTGEMRPPVRTRAARPTTGRDSRGRFVKPRQGAEDGEPREAHPGGWADVTGTLMRGYGHRVESDGTTLHVFNEAPHAAALEGRDDYWVVEGLVAGGVAQEITARRVQEGLDAAVGGGAR